MRSDMAMILQTQEQKDRREVIYKMLDDLCKSPAKIDAVTDFIYQLIWDDK